MDDLISRQAVLYELHLLIEALKIHRFDYDALITICSKKLKNLPSVQSKQKTGHWVCLDDDELAYGCSACRSVSLFESKYCPNCGAYMKGESNDQTTSN